jgi:peroxiredoxin
MHIPPFPKPRSKPLLCAAFFAGFLLLSAALAFGQALPLSSLLSRAGLLQVRAGLAAPDFSLARLDGATVKLSDYRGKVVFLNFWATWCPPCREEMPSMNSLYRRYKDTDLVFLAVDLQESQNEVAAFVREAGYEFPVLLDSRGRAAALYGVQSIPSTFIIGRNGEIATAAIGGRAWDSPEVRAVIDRLLSATP